MNEQSSLCQTKHVGQGIVEAMGVFTENCVYGRQSLGETTHSFENCPTKGALSSNSSRIVNVQAM